MLTPHTSFLLKPFVTYARRELVPGGVFEDTCLRMDSLRIRPAASGDAATIGRLLEQLGYPMAVEHGALRIQLTSALHRESAHEFYKARDYEHTGVRLTKVFVNRSGSAPRGKGRSSRKGRAQDARNQSGA